MDKLIAQLNIEHFQRKLAEETDLAKRRTILCLLADEITAMAAIEAAQLKEKTEKGYDAPFHCRQWVGDTSTRSWVSALIHPF